MSQLELKTYPDPCLRIKTKPIEEFDGALEEIVRSMADMMYVSQGVGLAATQVGLGLSLLVMDPGDGLQVLANPQIVDKSKKKTALGEGCLSLPGMTVNVFRPEEIKVRAQNEHGEFFLKKYSGLAAKVVQHEMDHLKGRLIIDYLNPFSYFIAKRKFKKDAEGINKEKACEVVCNARK